ncbi:hypothetical protein L6452_02720 [Arctium lappa]|uniref:Uncharacterized protein n=1 Tax=Arctium lappa TaxID=4217 RepID=A0ACB9FK88_ARCLA|nr:hypothetical protein L6452_02720 [Arctium lappa]
MVGGGSRKDEPIAISNTNVFAALGNLNKKKKEGSSKKAGSSKKEQVFWAPAPLTMKPWADVDDEDDDDYYATTAPPPSVWPPAADDGVDHHNVKGIQLQLRLNLQNNLLSLLHLHLRFCIYQFRPLLHGDSESESEDEGFDESDDEENAHESEAVIQTTAEVLPPKESDKQLSKKELKKKELAELEAVLAELGLNESNGKHNSSVKLDEKVENENRGVREKRKKHRRW